MRRSEWMRRAGWCCVVCAANVPLAQALDIQLGSGISSEYSTNVLRTERDPQADLMGSVWGGVSLTERSANLNAEVAAAADARTYVDDTVSDDVLFSLASTIDLAISPRRLIWHLENYFQQTRASPLEPEGPDNRQDTNVLWTGPELILRLAKLYTIELSGRYGDYYYADTDGDNSRLAGSVRATRRLSTLHQVYVDYERMGVEYDHAGAIDAGGVPHTDFDRTDIYGGWAYESVLSELHLELGGTRIERDGLDDADGLLAALSLRRRLANEAAIGARIVHHYTDGSSNLLATGGGRLSVDEADDGDTQDIVYERLAELFYDGRWGVSDVGIRLYRRDEDYEVALLDRVGNGVRAELGYRFAPAWRGRFYGDYRHRDYSLLDRTDDDLSAGVGASYLLRRHISVDMDLRYDSRASTQAGSDFNETVAFIGVRYGERPHWSER